MTRLLVLLIVCLGFVFHEAQAGNKLDSSLQKKYFEELAFLELGRGKPPVLIKWKSDVFVGVMGEISEEQLGLITSTFMKLGNISGHAVKMAVPLVNREYRGSANIYVVSSNNLNSLIDKNLKGLIVKFYLDGDTGQYENFKRKNVNNPSNCHSNVSADFSGVIFSLIFIKNQISFNQFQKCLSKSGLGSMGLLGGKKSVPNVWENDANTITWNEYEEWALKTLYDDSFYIGQTKPSAMSTLHRIMN